MKPKILEREKIELNDFQTRMIKSGWGEEVVNNSVVEKITYLSDGLKVKGYAAYPKNLEEKKYPCIIWNRGGYEESGAIDAFNARGIYGQIASWGFVVFASQYRGNSGGEGKEMLGGDDVNDVLNLIPLANDFPQADSNIWGIEGWSRGGMMTFLTLLIKPDFNFKCAVLSGAISNIKKYAENNSNQKKLYKKIFGEENYNSEIEKRTIINFADKLPKIPYLLMHGASDETVPAEQSLELSKKFLQLNIEHKLIIFEKGDHFLKTHRKEVSEEKKKWFKRYLI